MTGLLILFGGGCTIVFIAVDGDLEFLWLWLALGVAPLVGGFFLIRYALKLLRERREQPSGGDKS